MDRYFKHEGPTSFAKSGFFIRLEQDDSIGAFERSNDQGFKSQNKSAYLDVSREDLMYYPLPVFIRDDLTATYKLTEQ